METVKQRSKSDCTVCCLAMALGRDYEAILEAVGPVAARVLVDRGMPGELEHPVMEALGLARNADYRQIAMSPHHCTTGFLRNLLWGRRAIVTVRSRNNVNGYHAIYFDGEELHDPTNAAAFEWGEVEPTDIVIFNERPA